MNPKLLWLMFLATTLVQFVGSLAYFFVASDTAVIQATYLLTKLVMLAAPVTMIALGWPLSWFTLRRRTRSAVTLGLGSGLAVSAVILAVFLAFRADFQPAADAVRARVISFGFLGYYAVAAMAFSLSHSLFEEYFWRWYVVRGLGTHLSPARAVLLGNSLFALHHFVVLSQFFSPSLTVLFGILVGVGGVMWSWTHERTGSLLAPWISHALVDGTLFLIGYILLLG